MSRLTVRAAAADGVATITLADPATLNAASLGMTAELADAFAGFADPASGIGCVILTGDGRAFSSGADINELGSGGVDAETALDTVYNPFVSALRDYPLPIVAAVNGPAAGIGCSIALACDLIVAAESAYFLLAFRRIGLVPDGGATYLLPRWLGKARAMELALLGDRLPARTALDWGLINRCVADDQLMPTARELAQTLASGPLALGEIRKLVWAGLESGWDDHLQAERAAQRRASASDDFREGVAAFREKRPTAFRRR